MIKISLVLFLGISGLALGGCSSNNDLSESELIEYQIWQSCIDSWIEENSSKYNSNESLIDDSIKACKTLTPGK